MKRIALSAPGLVTCGLLLLAASGPAGVCRDAGAQDELNRTGRQVMEELERRQETETEYAELTMLLVDKTGYTERRDIRRYQKRMAGGARRSLIAFMEPPDVRGTALLSWDRDEGEDNMWLYLPSLRRLQRVASGSKKTSFMGTDFAYEDLEPENINEYRYTRLDDQAVDGAACYLIEAVPSGDRKQRESGYGKRTLWVRKDIFLVVKIEYFDRRGKKIKTETSVDLYNVEGTLWRARKVVMDGHARNHRTAMALTVLDVNPPVEDVVFTDRFITSGRHIE